MLCFYFLFFFDVGTFWRYSDWCSGSVESAFEVLWDTATLCKLQLFIRRKLTLESLKQDQYRWSARPHSIRIIPLVWISVTIAVIFHAFPPLFPESSSRFPAFPPLGVGMQGNSSLHSYPYSPHYHPYYLHSHPIPRIPFIPFPDSPFWLLQIAIRNQAFMSCFFKLSY